MDRTGKVVARFNGDAEPDNAGKNAESKAMAEKIEEVLEGEVTESIRITRNGPDRGPFFNGVGQFAVAPSHGSCFVVAGRISRVARRPKACTVRSRWWSEATPPDAVAGEWRALKDCSSD